MRSTKIKAETEAEEKPKSKEHDIHIMVYDPKEVMYTDQTGKFPHMSSRGNKYTMVLTEIDTNSIWVEAMKNKTEGEMILARRRALARMKRCGILPKKQVLDNEASANYKQEMTESGMTYELVPPDNHRRNLAKKAIQTWKDHFVGVLSGTADTFPLHLWCQAIPQAERQLLLLQQSNIHPHLSAYAHVYGPHNYDAHPFVPIGMETLVHEKPKRRKTFAEHCKKGFVLGTSFEHYRAWTMWMNDTRATRVSGTVFHKHKYISTPAVTPADAVIAAAGRLANALQGKFSSTLADEPLAELSRLSDLFTQASVQPTPELQATPQPPEAPGPARRSPRLTTKVTANGRIIADPAPRPAPPLNPPIPPPGLALRLPRLTTAVSSDGRITAVPRPRPQAVHLPRVDPTAFPPRVIPPRRSLRLATKAQLTFAPPFRSTTTKGGRAPPFSTVGSKGTVRPPICHPAAFDQRPPHAQTHHAH